MARGIFVTGTDTGVGKTIVAAALLRGLTAAGLRAVGMKPVAAGIDDSETVPADTRALMAAGNIAALYGDMEATYLVVDRIGIRVLRDPYTNKPFVHFYTTKRVGGGVHNPEPMRALKVSA